MKTVDLRTMRQRKYIIKLQGREYTTHAGLLATAHEHGLKGVTVDLHSWDPSTKQAVMSATAHGERGTYTDWGDASPKNVGKNIAEATLRMAATRASSRALRLYLGVGMTCFEELPGGAGKGETTSTPAAAPTPAPAPAQRQHDASFEITRGSFMATLKNVGFDYGEVCYICEELKRPRPSEMTQEQRNNLVTWLAGMKEDDRASWAGHYENFLNHKEQERHTHDR